MMTRSYLLRIADRGLRIGDGAARRLAWFACFIPATLIISFNVSAAETNAVSLTQPPMPDVGGSLLRVMGSLILVLAIFLGGVWLFRNWQRLTLHRNGAPKLNVIEARSLGGRHALYVVGYEQERFLVAASPTGVNLLSHLQPADPNATPDAVPAPPSFTQAVAQKLRGK